MGTTCCHSRPAICSTVNLFTRCTPKFTVQSLRIAGRLPMALSHSSVLLDEPILAIALCHVIAASLVAVVPCLGTAVNVTCVLFFTRCRLMYCARCSAQTLAILTVALRVCFFSQAYSLCSCVTTH